MCIRDRNKPTCSVFIWSYYISVSYTHLRLTDNQVLLQFYFFKLFFVQLISYGTKKYIFYIILKIPCSVEKQFSILCEPLCDSNQFKHHMYANVQQLIYRLQIHTLFFVKKKVNKMWRNSLIWTSFTHLHTHAHTHARARAHTHTHIIKILILLSSSLLMVERTRIFIKYIFSSLKK